jgi:hypothetical protein
MSFIISIVKEEEISPVIKGNNILIAIRSICICTVLKVAKKRKKSDNLNDFP